MTSNVPFKAAKHHACRPIALKAACAMHAGVYFVKQFAHGMQFFEDWLYWFPKKIGHDQDGLNNVVS